MYKKENLKNDQNIIDLKKTQIELLKVDTELKKQIEDDKLNLKEYQKVFDSIKPISSYIDRIKNEIISSQENNLSKTSDEMVKLINQDNFNNYEFKYKKLQKAIVPLNLEPIKFEPKPLNLYTFDKEHYVSIFNKVKSYLNSFSDIEITDSNLQKDLLNKKLIIELQKKIEEIKKLIKSLKIHLDITKISNAVQLIKINTNKNKKSTLNLDSISLNPIDSNNVFNYQKIKLFGEETILEPNTIPFNLEGGDINTYLNNTSKNYLILNNLHLLKKYKKIFIETVYEFNVYYIQYKYYELFLIEKLNYIRQNKHKITVFLTLRKILSLYKSLNEKYKMIINPKKHIFNKKLDKNERNKRKKMFFQHYFQIYIIYHFFKFLMIKIIKELNITNISIDNINIDDYSDKFNDSKIIYLLDDDNDDNDDKNEDKIELQKLLVLINVFYLN